MQQPADAECSVCTLDGLKNVIVTAASEIDTHAVVVADKDEQIAACDDQLRESEAASEAVNDQLRQSEDQLREAQAETAALKAELADGGSNLWAWSEEECLRRVNEQGFQAGRDSGKNKFVQCHMKDGCWRYGPNNQSNSENISFWGCGTFEETQTPLNELRSQKDVDWLDLLRI